VVPVSPPEGPRTFAGVPVLPAEPDDGPGGPGSLPWEVGVRAARLLVPTLDAIPVFLDYSADEADAADSVPRWVDAALRAQPAAAVCSVQAEGVDQSPEDRLAHALCLSARGARSADDARSRAQLLAAKRHGLPIVVVDGSGASEPRSFPYDGNVPTVRGT